MRLIASVLPAALVGVAVYAALFLQDVLQPDVRPGWTAHPTAVIVLSAASVILAQAGLALWRASRRGC